MQTDWRGAQNIAGAGGGRWVADFISHSESQPSPASPAPVLQS